MLVWGVEGEGGLGIGGGKRFKGGRGWEGKVKGDGKEG